MQSLILEIQDKMAVYAKHARSNRDAVEAIEKLKQLSEDLQDVEKLQAQIDSINDSLLIAGVVAHG